VRRRNLDNHLSHRLRKRFGQNYRPEWFFYVFCEVREVGMGAEDDFADKR
jgi:hypothetical protein